jgi:succinate dehydrogenase/fumarate reductase flavoprotein subunit
VVNAPLGKDDSPDSFAATPSSGDELCDGMVKTFTQEASKEVIWLERMGVPFNRQGRATDLELNKQTEPLQ